MTDARVTGNNSFFLISKAGHFAPVNDDDESQRWVESFPSEIRFDSRLF